MEQLTHNEEFTFKQLFALIKKSAFRILIFCLIAAFVMAIITVGVYFGMSSKTESVTAIIEFAYKGADEGYLPNSTERLNANRIKAVNVVNGAISVLESEGYSLTTSATDISDRISVSGIIPQDIAKKLDQDLDLSYFPTKYKIVLSGLDQLGLDKMVAERLLDEVINQYSENFKNSYLLSDFLSLDVIQKVSTTELLGTSAVQKDYLQITELLSSKIGEAISLLNTMKTINPAYQQVLNRHIDALNDLKNADLGWCEFFVLNNGISLNPSSLHSYYKEQMDRLSKQVDGYEKLAKSLKDELESDKYKFGSIEIITPEGGTSLIKETVSEEFSLTYLKMIDALTQQNALETQISVYEIYLEKFKGDNENNTVENRADATIQLKAISGALKETFEEINQTIAQFNSSEMGRSILINMPAAYVLNSGNTLIILLVISLIIIILAAVVAVVVTNTILKNPKKTCLDIDSLPEITE